MAFRVIFQRHTNAGAISRNSLGAARPRRPTGLRGSKQDANALLKTCNFRNGRFGGPLVQRSLLFAYTSSAAAGDVRELVVDEAENECLGGFVVESFDHLD